MSTSKKAKSNQNNQNEEYIFNSDVSNDRIDIYREPDVTLKKIKTDSPENLKIKISGGGVDNSVANALRRTILLDIPIYGFHRSNVVVDVEKSLHMYNNDLIYNQLETLPIFDVPNFFDLENPELYLSNEVMKSLFGTFIQDKYIDESSETHVNEANNLIDSKKELFKIELNMNVTNNTDDFKFVSTHDCVLKVNGEISDSYLIREPIAVLVLKPGEYINLKADANLGLAKILATYEATTNVLLNKLSDSSYEIKYETLGQLDKYVIFNKACTILIKKLQYLKRFIKDQYKEEPDENEIVEIQLHGENHTLGNLISMALQKCDLIREAGYVMAHPFLDNIIIKYKMEQKQKVGPIRTFLDVITYLIKLFEKILKQSTSKSSS